MLINMGARLSPPPKETPGDDVVSNQAPAFGMGGIVCVATRHSLDSIYGPASPAEAASALHRVRRPRVYTSNIHYLALEF